MSFKNTHGGISDLDIVIFCGGRGHRIKELTGTCYCKSLIEIHGRPAIEYVLRVVRSLTPERIYLCLDRQQIAKYFEVLLRTMKIENVNIYLDKGRGPMATMYEVSGLCTKNHVLLLFGHHLITTTHLQTMWNKRQTAALSCFKTTSESHCKIASLDDEGRCKRVTRHDRQVHLLENEWYIDVPYLLPTDFFLDGSYPTLKRLFVKAPFEKTTLSHQEVVYGIEADFPHEFHCRSELRAVESLAIELLKSMIDIS